MRIGDGIPVFSWAIFFSMENVSELHLFLWHCCRCEVAVSHFDSAERSSPKRLVSGGQWAAAPQRVGDAMDPSSTTGAEQAILDVIGALKSSPLPMDRWKSLER